MTKIKGFWQLKKITKTFLVLTILLPVIDWVIRHIVVIRSRSINHYVAWIMPQSLPKANSLIMFKLKDWPAASIQKRPMTLKETQWFKKIHTQFLTKRIGCHGGRLLNTIRSRDETQYYCDNTLIATATKYPEMHFIFNGNIPKQKIFAIGDHPQSLDSRYFGFVDLNEAKRLYTTAELIRGEFFFE